MSNPQQEAKKHYEKQRRQAYHQSNLQGQQDDKGAEVLEQLSQNADLPIQPEDDDIVGQFFAEASAKANLSEEELESIKWEREIDGIFWLCNQPSEDGMHGTWKGWVHGDSEKADAPLASETRAKFESALTSHKEVISLSKEGFSVKESTRNVSQSIVDEEEESSGSSGLLGKLR